MRGWTGGCGFPLTGSGGRGRTAGGWKGLFLVGDEVFYLHGFDSWGDFLFIGTFCS